jgi:excisionase family DNA binding protein
VARNESKGEQWLTIRQVSERLGVHETTLRRWADHGAIKVIVTPGGHRRFLSSDIAQFEGNHTQNREALIASEQAARATMTIRESVPHQHWMGTCDQGEHEVNRLLGRRLMGLVLQSVASPEECIALCEEARTIGREKARSGLRLGLSLFEMLRGVSLFRRSLLETAIGGISEVGARQKETTVLLVRRIESLISEFEMGIVEMYDHTERSPIEQLAK